jgi:hypothetical protein
VPLNEEDKMLENFLKNFKLNSEYAKEAGALQKLAPVFEGEEKGKNLILWILKNMKRRPGL